MTALARNLAIGDVARFMKARRIIILDTLEANFPEFCRTERRNTNVAAPRYGDQLIRIREVRHRLARWYWLYRHLPSAVKGDLRGSK